MSANNSFSHLTLDERRTILTGITNGSSKSSHTKGTFSVNEIAHFIVIGEYKLFSYMRNVGLLFKNENGDNVSYENQTNKGKFTAIPAIAPDGTAHLQTRIYPDGISYITKLLRKYGYLEVA